MSGSDRESLEAFKKIREMTFWPFGLGADNFTAEKWSKQNWAGIQAVANEQVQRLAALSTPTPEAK